MLKADKYQNKKALNVTALGKRTMIGIRKTQYIHTINIPSYNFDYLIKLGGILLKYNHSK